MIEKPTQRDLEAGEELVRAGLLDENPDYDAIVRKLDVIRAEQAANDGEAPQADGERGA